MTRAVVATAYGGPEVLEIVDVDPGRPGPGEVLVGMRAAGVNPADWKSYSGRWGTDPDRLPLRLGYELAGVVEAVGPDVDGLAVGDDVVAHQVTGAYADRLVVPAAVVVPKPPTLDWPQAAGLLLAGSTAWHALAAVRVGAGDTLLVHGASGSVGALVTQLARIRGARVLGTAAAGNQDLVEELGAIPVAYGAGLEDRVRRLGRVDAAIDTTGTDEALDVSVAVTDRRRVATIAGFAHGARLGVHLLGGGPGGDPGTQVRAEARPRLVELAGAGRLRVRVDTTHRLEYAAQAHRAVRAGTRGKVVLVP